MNNYEGMFIVKPDLSEDERKGLFSVINDIIIKHNGSVTQSAVWSERRKLIFPIKRCHEGVYYLVNFSIAPAAITKIKELYRLNEGVLRVLITVAGKKLGNEIPRVNNAPGPK